MPSGRAKGQGSTGRRGRPAPPPRGPDFFCIGAQKAGTTWLHANLRRHPGVWLPPLKEVQYFNQIHLPGHRGWTQKHRDERIGPRLISYLRRTERPNLAFVRLMAHLLDPQVDDDWYRKIFAQAGPDRICGEMTPEYSLLPEAGIEHLLRVSPQARIILLMRDPIDRGWSQLRMLARRRGDGAVEMALLEQVAAELVARADYPSIIDRWQARVGPARLFTAFFERIATDPEGLLKAVTGFLGLEDRAAEFPAAREVVHEGQRIDIPAPIHDRLRALLEPVYDAMARRFPAEAEGWRQRHFA